MKTKIKITLIVIFILITTIIATLITLSLNNIQYNVKTSKPSRIIVYCGAETNNQVFEPSDKEFDIIYSLIIEACQQPILKAFVEGELDKDAKIIQNDNQSINFSGVIVNFEYDAPQVVGYKNKTYNYNNSTYWYQNLIFNISSQDDFGYNSVAIIPPMGDKYYINAYTYNLSYQLYSNFSKVYAYVQGVF